MLKKSALLLGVCLALLTGCKGGPQITLCLLDAVSDTLECADPKQNVTTIPIGQADNYVCMSPDDMEKLLQWMELRCRK